MFGLESSVMTVLLLASIAVKVWALVDAIVRPAAAFPAADKLTKNAWLAILGLTLVTAIVFPAVIGIFALVGLVAALVYLVDVRPALSSATRR